MDTYQRILALQVIPLGVSNYLIFFLLVVIIVIIGFLLVLLRM